MNLQGRCISACELSRDEKNRMFEILTTYYNNILRETFERDLREKDWVILLHDAATRKIQGFSTQMVLDLSVAGVPVKAIFSGDTIIEKGYWGKSALFLQWLDFACCVKEMCGARKLYWFLISMGYKTYHILPLYFKEFYPRFDKGTPRFEKEVLDVLGSMKYPVEYDCSDGVFHFSGSSACLKPGVADIDERRLRNPHIRFFTEKNPCHGMGDELACLAEVSLDNFTPAVNRLLAALDKTGAVV